MTDLDKYLPATERDKAAKPEKSAAEVAREAERKRQDEAVGEAIRWHR